jgi:hypothetical protein
MHCACHNPPPGPPVALIRPCPQCPAWCRPMRPPPAPDNIDKLINGAKPAFIEFYAPWWVTPCEPPARAPTRPAARAARLRHRRRLRLRRRRRRRALLRASRAPGPGPSPLRPRAPSPPARPPSRCGHCKSMAPEIVKLGQALEASPEIAEKVVVGKASGRWGAGAQPAGGGGGSGRRGGEPSVASMWQRRGGPGGRHSRVGPARSKPRGKSHVLEWPQRAAQLRPLQPPSPPCPAHSSTRTSTPCWVAACM